MAIAVPVSEFYLDPYALNVGTNANPEDLRGIQSILIKAQQTIPWLPDVAGYPGLLNPGAGKFPKLNSAPQGLTAEQLATWKKIWGAVQPIFQAFWAGQRAQAKAEGLRLEANVAFWDDIHKKVKAVAELDVGNMGFLIPTWAKNLALYAAIAGAGYLAWKFVIKPRMGAHRLATNPRRRRRR